jgi:hypothetical protein
MSRIDETPLQSDFRQISKDCPKYVYREQDPDTNATFTIGATGTSTVRIDIPSVVHNMARTVLDYPISLPFR